MPELPDVEEFRKFLEETSLNQPIRRAVVHTPRILDGISVDAFESALPGRQLVAAIRHGKYLFAPLDAEPPNVLFMHFGMTGYLESLENPRQQVPHARVSLEFDSGKRLVYVCPRMFGRVGLARDMEEVVKEKNLGPDALAIDRAGFNRVFAHKAGAVKPVLMDQHLVAGIGNVYADEILFQARLHPQRRMESLSGAERDALYREVGQVLEKAVGWHADPKRFDPNFLLPRRHKNGTCPRDHERLAVTRVGGRTTYFCPRCQSTL